MNVLNNNKIPWENVFEYATEDLSMYLWAIESWIDPPDGYDQEYILLLILNSRARSRSAISLIKENIPPEHYQNRDQLNILWQKGEKLLYNFIETNYEDILYSVDALILVTGHNEFKKIDPNFLSSKMKNPIVIDTRGILNLDEVKKSNLIFRGLGRGFT